MLSDNTFDTYPFITSQDNFIPMEKLLKVLGQEHVLEVLEFIQAHGKANFKDLKGLTKHPASVSRALRKLKDRKLIERAVLNDERRSVEYTLTDKGKCLVPIIEELKEIEDS